jgi:glyoxylate/hydroxypyruvate reductase A
MDVLLAATAQASAWREAFAQALPDARLHVWPRAPKAVDFALVWKPPPEVFEKVRVRTAIFNLGAGADALLAISTLPRGVPIVRLEDAGMAMQMAEYVTLAVLGAYREQRVYAEQQREARWRQRERLRKQAFCVGLLGLGVLGKAVADALRPFGFPMLAWSRTARTVEGIEAFTGTSGLESMLARSRVLVALLPLTPQTQRMLDRSTLAKLPRGAHLVNVARGGLVDDDDLVALLDEGHLRSATLDVFDVEPLPATHRFWHHPKIVLTPHVSAATLVDESAAQVVAKMHALARGEAVSGIVDVERGY